MASWVCREHNANYAIHIKTTKVYASFLNDAIPIEGYEWLKEFSRRRLLTLVAKSLTHKLLLTIDAKHITIIRHSFLLSEYIERKHSVINYTTYAIKSSNLYVRVCKKREEGHTSQRRCRKREFRVSSKVELNASRVRDALYGGLHRCHYSPKSRRWRHSSALLLRRRRRPKKTFVVLK